MEDRRLQDAQAKVAKRKSASVRKNEANAKITKRQTETEKEREGRKLQDAQGKKAKRQAETEKTEGFKMFCAGKSSDRLKLKRRGKIEGFRMKLKRRAKTEGFKMLRARKPSDSRRL
jgi:hypothetical protein